MHPFLRPHCVRPLQPMEPTRAFPALDGEKSSKQFCSRLQPVGFGNKSRKLKDQEVWENGGR